MHDVWFTLIYIIWHFNRTIPVCEFNIGYKNKYVCTFQSDMKSLSVHV